MQRMHGFHDGQCVLPTDQGTSAQVRVLQALGKLIHVHFAMGVAWYGNAAAGMGQRWKEQLMLAGMHW